MSNLKTATDYANRSIYYIKKGIDMQLKINRYKLLDTTDQSDENILYNITKIIKGKADLGRCRCQHQGTLTFLFPQHVTWGEKSTFNVEESAVFNYYMQCPHILECYIRCNLDLMHRSWCLKNKINKIKYSTQSTCNAIVFQSLGYMFQLIT